MSPLLYPAFRRLAGSDAKIRWHHQLARTEQL